VRKKNLGKKQVSLKLGTECGIDGAKHSEPLCTLHVFGLDYFVRTIGLVYKNYVRVRPGFVIY